MSTQYNKIGSNYKTIYDLPLIKDIEEPNLKRIIGNIQGQKCLDLACGLGRWSKYLIHQNASQVTGIDISDSMIQNAKVDATFELSSEQQSRLAFHIGDCSKPFTAPNGPFDFALGAFFLNYAESYTTLLGMFRTIHNNLRPGARFVGMTINTFCPPYEPLEYYGIRTDAIAAVPDGGWKCKFEALDVRFEYYHFMHDVYERAAREAGMGEIKWHGYVLPDNESGYWDMYQLRGHFCILSCYKKETPGGA